MRRAEKSRSLGIGAVVVFTVLAPIGASASAPPDALAPSGEAPPDDAAPTDVGDPLDAPTPSEGSATGEIEATLEGGSTEVEVDVEVDLAAEPAPASVPPPDEGAPGPEGAVKKVKKKKKKKKEGEADDPEGADDPAGGAPKKTKKKTTKKKTKKAKEPHKVNHGTRYHLGLFPGVYAQDKDWSVGAQAGLRQDLEPKKNHRLSIALDYEYEPFSTKTLGFPEEDDTSNTLQRTLVQPIHIVQGRVFRQIKWGKLVTTELELVADAWWPSLRQHQRWSTRLTPWIRIGKRTGVYGELGTVLYYKKFPNYLIADRRIDQEGAASTAAVGYNLRKVARFTAGFTFDYTDYLDSRYNMAAPDGTFPRARESKNYLSFMPWGELQVRPIAGLRLRGRYSFERQITQHYNRVMTGRDEFFSLQEKYFVGYYDFRRHKVQLRVNWEFRDRFSLAAMAEGWVRHFDVYEARAADNSWTGQLRLDTELEGSLEAAVRAYTFKTKRRQHDLYVSLLGAHVSRNSNQMRQISLSTNFDITRIFLGIELRGR